MHSRPLQSICCLTQAALFNFCLSESDLEHLGAWDAQPNPHGFSPALWSRALLHRRCSADDALARRVADRLDLAHIETVMLIRVMDADAARGLVDLWVERPCGAVLPGLLWALCSDARGPLSALGTRLGHEAGVVAGRRLASESHEPSTKSDPRPW